MRALDLFARRRIGVAACALALSMTGGCSLAFTRAPPANHAELRYFDCPSSYVAPATDTVLTAAGGLAVLGALLVVAASSSGFIGSQQADGGAYAKVGLLAIPAVGLPLGSAISGYSKVGRCRDAKSQLMTRIVREGAEAPKPYDPG